MHAVLDTLPVSWRAPTKAALFAAVRATPGQPTEQVIAATIAARRRQAGK